MSSIFSICSFRTISILFHLPSVPGAPSMFTAVLGSFVLLFPSGFGPGGKLPEGDEREEGE